MTLSTKVGLGFVAFGLAAGFAVGILDIEGAKTPVYVVVGVACFVTVFWLKYRERTK